MQGELGEERFINIDEWVPKTLGPVYRKEILDKLLRRKKPEETKKKDPLFIGGGYANP